MVYNIELIFSNTIIKTTKTYCENFTKVKQKAQTFFISKGIELKNLSDKSAIVAKTFLPFKFERKYYAAINFVTVKNCLSLKQRNK